MKHRSLTNRLLLGLGANSLGQVVNLMIQLVSVPLLLTCWGKQMYGEWLLLSTIPAYLATSDIGFGAAAANEMGQSVGRSDYDSALSCFQTIWALITCISAMLTLIVIVAVHFLPVYTWAHIVAMSPTETIVVASMLAATVVCNQQSSVLLAGYKCAGMYAGGVMWVNAQRVGEFLAVVIVAFAGYRPPMAAFIMFLVGIIVRVLMYYQMRRRIPWLKMGVSHFKTDYLRRLWYPAVSYLGFPIGNALRYQGMASVVGIQFGPPALVGFSAIRTVCNIPMQLSGCIANAVWPELSITFGKGNIALARQMHRHACQASLAMSVAAITGLALVGPTLIDIWTKHKVQVDYGLFAGFLAVVGANSFWTTSSVVPSSVNRHYRITAFILGLTAVAVGVAPFFAGRFGIKAISYLLCVVDLVMVVLTLRVSLRLVEDTPMAFIAAMFTLPEVRGFSRRNQFSETSLPGEVGS